MAMLNKMKKITCLIGFSLQIVSTFLGNRQGDEVILAPIQVDTSDPGSNGAEVAISAMKK